MLSKKLARETLNIHYSLSRTSNVLVPANMHNVYVACVPAAKTYYNCYSLL